MLDLSIAQHIGLFLLTWVLMVFLLVNLTKLGADSDSNTQDVIATFFIATVVALGITLIL